MYKKVLIISLLILITCIGAVCAEDNATGSIGAAQGDDIQADSGEQLGVDERKDADFGIEFGEVYVPRWSQPDGPYLLIGPAYDDMAGNFTVFVDGDEFGFGEVDYFTNPTAELWAPYYDLGPHTILVQYSGDELYKPLNKTHVFSVEEVNVVMCSEEYVLGDDGISVDLPAKASGSVTLYINDVKKQTVKVTSLDDEAEDVGLSNIVSIELDRYLKFNETYSVKIEYNVKHYGKTLKGSKTGNITSVTYPLEISTDYEYEYGNENTVSVYAPKYLSKSGFNVSIDGTPASLAEYSYLDEDLGQVTYYVDVTDCKPGSHSIDVTYIGDGNYPEKHVGDTFSVFSRIKMPEPSIEYNSSDFVRLILPGDATGNLTVRMKQENGSFEITRTQELINGKAEIQLSTEHVGFYSLEATYSGNYEIENITGDSLEISPIIKYPNSMIWGENKFVTIKTDMQANGTLYLYRYGKLYRQVDVTNGSANISLANFPAGTYYDGEIEIKYNNSNYEVDWWWCWITVKPQLKLTGPSSMYYGDGKSFSAKIYGKNGKTASKDTVVTFKVGSKTFKVKTNAKGIATLKIPNTIQAGKYTVRVIFKGFSASQKLTVRPVVALKAVTVKKYAKKLTLTATLKKGKTPLKYKKVTFKFNGKTYKAKTNRYGVAKVTVKKSVLNKLKVGKNVAYQVTYLKATVKKTAKVKR